MRPGTAISQTSKGHPPWERRHLAGISASDTGGESKAPGGSSKSRAFESGLGNIG
jgi:hypothetical protein